VAHADNSPRCFQFRFNSGALELIAFNTSNSAFTASIAGAGVAGALSVVVGRVQGTAVTAFSRTSRGSATITATPRGISGTYSIGNRVSTNPLNGQFLLHLRWNRPLSDGEVASIQANPWQIFEPQVKSMSVAGVAVYRPASDIIVNSWTPSTGSDLYAMIDDPTLNRSDFITSPNLTNPVTMGWNTPLVAGTYDVSVDFDRTGANGQLRIVLLDSGGTAVGTSSWQAAPSSAATTVFSVTTTGTSDRFRIEVQT